MKLCNESTGIILAERALLKRSFGERLVGAMGREIPAGCAIGITHCDWVHTFFVTGPLDLLYCDSAGRVLCVRKCVPPFRLPPGVRGADIVWELPGGTLSTSNAAVGDRLVILE